MHPGGRVSDIRLRYEGTTELKLVNGAIIATTPYGSITEAAPYSYMAETKGSVASSYVLKGNELSFGTGSYDGTLVIDPVLVWGTYYGSNVSTSGNGFGIGVATDIYENVYLCGNTGSTNNIATTGTHQTVIGGGVQDAFMVKLDSGCTRQWATYYGGIGSETFLSVACDKNGYVYAGGVCDTFSAKSGSLSSSSAHQINYGGTGANSDAFLVRFNPTNGQRVWGTLYGGNLVESSASVACDKTGNVYLGGTTSSINNIATNGTHKSSHNGGTDGLDGFIAKFNSNGVRQWGTYYGGNVGWSSGAASDGITSIACDNTGSIYVVGQTTSTNGIAYGSSHQGSISGSFNGLMAKFNSSTGTIVWGTYYGGTVLDAIASVYADEYSNVYIGGMTWSSSGIATNNTYKPVLTYSAEGFVAMFNSSGVRQWGSYYGGVSGLFAGISGIMSDKQGKIYVTGMVSGNSSIATSGSHQVGFGGGNDAFLGVFTATGQLDYGTYYGGSGTEWYGGADGFNSTYGQCLALSNYGRVYIAGMTNSTSNIAYGNNIHQNAYVGTGNDYNAFLVAFDSDTIVYIPQRYTDTVWCPGDTVKIAFGVNRQFGSGNSFVVQLSDAAGSFTSPVTIGSKSATSKDTVTCVIPLNTPAGTGYRIRIKGSNPVRTSWDNQWDIRVKALPANVSNSSNSPVCEADTLKLYGSTTSTGMSWKWAGPGGFSSLSKDTIRKSMSYSDTGRYILTATLNSTGCSLKDTTTVTVKALPDKPNANYNSPVCETKTLSLTTTSGTGGVSWGWTGPSGFSSITQNPSISNVPLSASGNYISTATINGCSSRDTVTVNVLPKPNRPTAGAQQTSLCAQQTLSLTASTVTSTGYRWYGPTGYTANTQNPTRPWMQNADAGKYFVYAELNGCISDTDSVAIVVSANPFVNIYPTPGQSICPGQNVIFTALPNNAGSSPGYQWYVNGAAISGANGVAYATTGIQDNDQVMCLMAVAHVCSTPFTDTSNIIIMAVNPKKKPSVSITSDVDPSLYPNEPITFTATATDAGNAPQYQWRRNGKDVGGATSQSWGANANFLSDGDVICVRVKSNYVCPDPDTAISNCITLDIRLGVGNVDNDKNIKIHPNPVTDRLTIESATAIARTELYDVVERKCEVETSPDKGGLVLDMSSLPQGNYILKLSTADGGTAVYKIVKVKS